jgi:CheY-like chemotaxis protein
MTTTGGRVLVVDDDQAVLDMLRERLERLGYEASTAGSVEQAIVAMARVQPHLVLLDLIMPGVWGLEALTYFRQRYRTVPVIIITGDAEQETAEKARAAGAFDVLTKPFSRATLESLLAQAMKPVPPR